MRNIITAATFATALLAGPIAHANQVTFRGQITPTGGGTSSNYTAVYAFDPAAGSLMNTREPGGLVNSDYTGPLTATISFDNTSFVIDDTDPTSPGQVFISEETEVSPITQTYIADANAPNASIFNYATLSGGQSTFSLGSFDTFSDGEVTASYLLTTTSVSAAPEPSTWMLLIVGVGLAGFSLRLRKRSEAGAVQNA